MTKFDWRVTATLILAATSTAAAQAVNVPGGRVEWQCGQRPDDCQLVRRDRNGLPVVSANPAEVGTARGWLQASRDGATIYAVKHTGTASLAALEAKTLRARWVTTPQANLTASDYLPPSLSESPDGQMLAVSRSGTSEAARDDWGSVALLRADTGATVRLLAHPGPPLNDTWLRYYRVVTALAFAPDGRTLAIGSVGGGIRLHDLTTDQEQTLAGACDRPRPTAHAGSVRDLLWTADGTLLSTANDGTVRRWQAGRQTACLRVPQGGWKLHALPDGQFLVQNATTFTLANLAPFQRVAELGPAVSAVNEVRVSPGKVTLADESSEQDYALPGGQFLAVRGPDLAQFRQGNVQVQVRPNMQVDVTRGGKTTTLKAKAVPPENIRGWNRRWSIALQGQELRVTATNHLRVMTMEGDDFQNRFTWHLGSGRLLSCQTWQMGLMYSGAPQQTDPDRACRVALQHGQRGQHVESLWHK